MADSDLDRRRSTRTGFRYDFQAVILAGGIVDDLQPLTQDTPKALLPIANRPMITYQLKTLEQSGITDVIIVTSTDAASSFREAVAGYTTAAAMDIKVEAILTEGGGTADALRRIKDKLRVDFVVMTCDIILRTSLDAILDAHRIHQGALTVQLVKQATDGDRRKSPIENFVILDDASDAVLMIKEKRNAGDLIDVRRCILNKYPSVSIQTDLNDCHLYVMSRWVLGILESRPSITSLKADLVPYLLRKQYSVSASDQDVFTVPASENLQAVAFQMTSALSPWPPGPAFASNLHCHACIVDAAEANYVRVKTVASYHEANRQMAKIHVPDSKEKIAQDELGRGVIGSESLVGPNVKVGARTSIKKSILGANCVLGDDVKLVNCVVMDGVLIKSGCTLSGTIVRSNAIVPENTESKDGVIPPAS
jgi:translation initiation factor eIF-2B subunit gamma